MSEAWKVPKRLVEVSCDIMPNLAVYRTVYVENRTRSSSVPTALTVAWFAYTSFCLTLDLVRSAFGNRTKLMMSHPTCTVQRHACIVI